MIFSSNFYLISLYIYLIKLRLQRDDPRWTFLSTCTNFIIKLKGNENHFINFCNRFIENNIHSSNLLTLIEQITSRLILILSKKNKQNKQNNDSCCASLHLLSLLINFFTSKVNSNDLRKIFDLSYNWPYNLSSKYQQKKSDHISQYQFQQMMNKELVISTFIDELFLVLQYCLNYDIIYFSSNLILSLFSTQLYQIGNNENFTTGKVNDDIFLQYIYIKSEESLKLSLDNYNCSDSLPSLILKGLINIITSNILPSLDSIINNSSDKNERIINEQEFKTNKNINESVNVKGVFMNSFELLINFPVNVLKSFINYTANYSDNILSNDLFEKINNDVTTNNKTQFNNNLIKISTKNKLTERCISILLILLHNKRVKYDYINNPIREVFSIISDNQLDILDNNDDIGSNSIIMNNNGRIHIDFKILIFTLIKKLPTQSCTCLLYSFLHLHPTFIETLLLTEQIENLLNVLLKGLYEIENILNIDHLYILCVCILILSSDSSCRNVMMKLSTSAPWYQNLSVNSIPLLDLIVLCIIKIILHALFKLQVDHYLLSNCYAILLNVAPYLTNIHFYTSERIIDVIKKISKRIIDANNTITTSINKEDEILIISMKETLDILLKLIGISIRPLKRESNVNLIYGLLHSSEKISEYLINPIISNSFQLSPQLIIPTSPRNSKNDLNQLNFNDNTEKNEEILNLNYLSNTEIISMMKHYLKLLDEQNNELKQSIFSNANKVNFIIYI